MNEYYYGVWKIGDDSSFLLSDKRIVIRKPNEELKRFDSVGEAAQYAEPGDDARFWEGGMWKEVHVFLGDAQKDIGFKASRAK